MHAIDRHAVLALMLMAAMLAALVAPIETFSDGLDFAMASSCLGNAHPPGYPAAVMLGKLFDWIPVGSHAGRMSVMGCTALLGAAIAVMMLYEAPFFMRLALVVIVSAMPTTLENALTGEIYALNLLFFVVLLYAANSSRDPRMFLTGCFLFGLGMGNHHSLAFIGLAGAGYVMYQKTTDLRLWICGAAFFLLGLSVYLYLPVRAAQSPPWNWGNPATSVDFIRCFLRLDFAGTGMGRDAGWIAAQLSTFNPFHEFGAGTWVLCAGAGYLAYRDTDRFLKCLGIMLLYSVGIVALLGNDASRTTVEELRSIYAPFFIPAYAMLALMFIESLRMLPVRIGVGFAAIAAALAGWHGVGTACEQLYARRMFAHDYAAAQLAMLPRNATVIAGGGETEFPMLYRAITTKLRDDVRIVMLSTLGKRWNVRSSIADGLAYTKGYAGEGDSQAAAVKAVALYQQEVRGRRVFAPFSDRDELPRSLDWQLNGLFWELGRGGALPLSRIRTRSAGGQPGRLIEDVLYTHAIQSSERGDGASASEAAELFVRFGGDAAAVRTLRGSFRDTVR